MIKASFISGLLFLIIGSYLCKFYDIIFMFLVYDLYFLMTVISLHLLSKELIVKAITLYLGWFLLLNFITDSLMIDKSLILSILFAVPLYILSAKKLLKSPVKPNLSFKHNYVIHCKPFRWYHWFWLLIGNGLDAYRTVYISDKQAYFRVENGVLTERKVNHETILREISAINADVSIAEVDYKELHNKVGDKFNCKKELY